MKQNKILAWMMAIAITSITMTACSQDKEVEKFHKAPLYACGISHSGTNTNHEVLFSEADIEWFDVDTREIIFRNMSVPLYKRLQPFNEIEFYLDDSNLFVVSSFVGLWDNRIYDNLVLCYGNQESTNIDGKYYLYDSYPLQYLDSDAVKVNQQKNASQWELFTTYLESKGKLKK